MTSTAELFDRISGDSWRITHPLSDDLLQANALLHNSAATDGEMAECAELWCLRRQPCQFGRVAASEGRIHFSFLRDEAITSWKDKEIAEKLREDKQLWKQRAAFDSERGAHSFMLIVASPRLALAAPDKHLKAFSDHLLGLLGWEPNRRGARHKNTVTSDFLYLQHPTGSDFYGYRFNADYFACAADGRWWHDHRCPGGIAFTANSTGHMIASREWYRGKSDGRSWALKQAMLTINNAQPTRQSSGLDPVEQGKVTWLRPLDEEGMPLVREVVCPISSMPKTLTGKDWTRYEGWLHTDHAVRDEFFLDRALPPTGSKPYLMDFRYLYDEKESEFVEFTGGKKFSEEQVLAEIGSRESWTHRSAKESIARSEAGDISVAEQLEACRGWDTLFTGDDSDL